MLEKNDARHSGDQHGAEGRFPASPGKTNRRGHDQRDESADPLHITMLPHDQLVLLYPAVPFINNDLHGSFENRSYTFHNPGRGCSIFKTLFDCFHQARYGNRFCQDPIGLLDDGKGRLIEGFSANTVVAPVAVRERDVSTMATGDGSGNS